MGWFDFLRPQPQPKPLGQLNRSAVLVVAKRPCREWARRYGLDLSNPDDGIAYLLPEVDSLDDLDIGLEKSSIWQMMFEHELRMCVLDESQWPKNRTFALFGQWFQVTKTDMVIDCAEEFLISLDRDILTRRD